MAERIAEVGELWADLTKAGRSLKGPMAEIGAKAS
jgi:hypothetical protein